MKYKKMVYISVLWQILSPKSQTTNEMLYALQYSSFWYTYL